MTRGIQLAIVLSVLSGITPSDLAALPVASPDGAGEMSRRLIGRYDRMAGRQSAG